MSTLLTSRKTVIGALLGGALLAGGAAGAAFAYPASTPLDVSATAAPSTAAGHVGDVAVMVTVTNANPGCQTTIKIDGTDEGALASGSTTSTATYYLPSTSTGRHRVSARTLDCTKGQKEHADSRFVIANAMTTGPGTGTAGSSYRAAVTGFDPGTDVTVTATLVGSNPLVQVSDSDTANSKGEGKVHFKFPKGATGTYTIATTVSPAGPTSASYSVTVS